MTVILNFPEADSLHSALCRIGIYSTVKDEITIEDLIHIDTVILTERHTYAIPKIKNENDNVKLIYIGEKQGNSVFCDICVRCAADIPGLFPKGDRLLFCGSTVIDTHLSNVEYRGKVVHLTAMEFHIVRCIATSKFPLSASLVSELVLGLKNPGLIMTHISMINKKISPVTGRYLIRAEHHRGYKITN